MKESNIASSFRVWFTQLPYWEILGPDLNEAVRESFVDVKLKLTGV